MTSALNYYYVGNSLHNGSSCFIDMIKINKWQEIQISRMNRGFILLSPNALLPNDWRRETEHKPGNKVRAEYSINVTSQ